MQQNRSWMIFVGATLLLALAVLLTALFSQNANAGVKDATSVFFIVTFSALAIERTIEGLWTFVGLTAHSFWPFNIVSERLESMRKSLDASLTPFYKDLREAMNKFHEAHPEEKIKDITDRISEFEKHIEDLKNLSTDNQRAQAIASVALQSANFFQARIKGFDPIFEGIKQHAKGITDFIDTFKDNPGRRLISLYIGVILGLIVSAVLGLNLLAIIVTSNTNTPAVLPALGVILTGVVIGLGSNPAHEIVKAIQEIKQGNKKAGLNVAPPPQFETFGKDIEDPRLDVAAFYHPQS